MKYILIATMLLLCCMESHGQHYISPELYDSLSLRYQATNNVAEKTRWLDRLNQGSIIHADQLDSFAIQYLTKVSSGKSRAGQIAALRLSFDKHEKAGQYDSALQSLFELSAIFDARHDTLDLESPVRTIGLIYEHLGRLEERMNYYQERLRYYTRHGPYVNLAICYHGLASYYRKKGDMNQTISNYLKAAEVSRTFSHVFYLNELYCVATYYREWGNADRARYYYSLFRKNVSSKYNSSTGLIIYHDLAKLDIKDHNYEAALRQLDSGKKYAIQIKDSVRPLRLDLIRAEVLIKQGRLDTARGLLDEIARRNAKLRIPFADNQGAFELDYTWYLYYKAIHDEARAGMHLAAAYQQAIKSRTSSLIQKYRRELAFWHAHRDPALALGYSNDYILLQDSLAEAAGPNNIAYYESVLQEKEATRSIDSLKEQRQRQSIQLADRKKILARTYAALALFVLLAGTLFYSYRLKARDNRRITAEKGRSEALLLNILPPEVAEELKETGAARANQFEHVTVLFTDFVNFTGTAEQLGPQALVQELHECFSAFDDIIDRNGLEKIKTIGDAYLAVCGLPAADERHAQKCVQAALDIMAFIEDRKKKEWAFELRIGINTGPVVAGIVGVKKFAYDIWGDTVNTAARMEQHGAPGRINISETTYELVKDEFECIKRGKIAAKHKGDVEMYFISTAVTVGIV